MVNVKELANKVVDYIKDQVEEDHSQYLDDEGNVDISRVSIDCAIESVLEKEDLMDINDDTFEAIYEAIDKKEIGYIEDNLRDELEDAEAYRRDPLAYHGLSQKDFL
jgi:hypothetical protein